MAAAASACPLPRPPAPWPFSPSHAHCTPPLSPQPWSITSELLQEHVSGWAQAPGPPPLPLAQLLLPPVFFGPPPHSPSPPSPPFTPQMSVAGAVESVSLMSYANGRSKGCAIVKYATPEEAQHAITALNDVEVDGRRLLVREDREGPEGPVPGSKPASAIVRGRGGIARGAGRGGRGGRGGLGGGAGGDAPRSRAAPSENAVYVGNLPWSVTWQNLKDMFTPYGATYSGELRSRMGLEAACGCALPCARARSC